MAVPRSGTPRVASLFLKAHFSAVPDYRDYVRQCRRMKNSDEWTELVSLGSEYAAEPLFQEQEGKKEIVNPIDDYQLGAMLNNVRSRLLVLMEGDWMNLL